jgi:hypothetical protein
MLGEGIRALCGGLFQTEIAQHQAKRVAYAAVGSGVVIRPVAARHFGVEHLKFQHCPGDAPDEKALREARRAADLGDKLGLTFSEEFSFPGTAVDRVADDAAAKGATIWAERRLN